jgi:ribonuclease Z
VGSLKVTIVGSGGAALTKERSCPCLLVEDEILLDCGSGSLKNLRHLDIDIQGIERILLSHLHNDHVGDLASIIWTMQMEGRKSPLEICGPRGTKGFVAQMLQLVRTPKGFLKFQVSCLDLMDDVRHDAFKWCRGIHVPEGRAYRIDGDGSLCYSGDTRPSSKVVELAKGVNLLIHDSVFPADEPEAAVRSNHSTATEAGEVADKAGASTLVLFHILGRGSGYEERLQREASERFRGKVLVAQDLMVLNVP